MTSLLHVFVSGVCHLFQLYHTSFIIKEARDILIPILLNIIFLYYYFCIIGLNIQAPQAQAQAQAQAACGSPEVSGYGFLSYVVW